MLLIKILKYNSKLSETAITLAETKCYTVCSIPARDLLPGACVRHHIQINRKIQKVTVSLRDIERA